MSGLDSWVPINNRTGGTERSLVPISSVNKEKGEDLSEEIKVRILMGNHLRDRNVEREPSEGWVTKFVSEDGKSVFGLTEEQYAQMLLLIGGIGSGKTNVMYHILDSIRSRMTRHDLIIVFDAKGDFFRRFYQKGDLVLGQSDRFCDITSYWNIYKEVMGFVPRAGERYSIRNGSVDLVKVWERGAHEILKSIMKDKKSEREPFFADAAVSLMKLRMIQVIRNGWADEMHTYKFKEFFKRATLETYDKLTMSEPDFAYARQYYGDGTTPQALGVFAELNNMIEERFIGVFGDECDENREISMSSLIRDARAGKGGKVVFIEYDVREGELLGPLYRILYDQCIKEGLGHGEEKGNIYLLCDELKLIGPSRLDDALNMGRSMGLKLVCGVQAQSQIMDIYGEQKGKSILSGFSNRFCFHCNDAETIKSVSEHFGGNYKAVDYWNAGTLKNTQTRESCVVEPWDVQRLQRGKAIIDTWKPIPQEPFEFQFPLY